MLSIKSFTTLLMLATAAVSSPIIVKRSSPKRGLAYNVDQAAVASLFNNANSWGYNWGSWKGDSDPINEFVPMCWGDSTVPNGPTIEKCKTELPAVIGNAKYLLAFNEPDYPTQANMDPQTAADKYMDAIQPFADKVKLGAPGVTSTQGDPSRGVEGWLKPFLEKCKASGCTIDFVPLHWYDTVGDAEAFKKHCESSRDIVRAIYPDATIWVTEFGSFLGDEAKNAKFMTNAISYLDGADYIERYSAFGANVGDPSGAFMASAGPNLNAIGRAYNS